MYTWTLIFFRAVFLILHVRCGDQGLYCLGSALGYAGCAASPRDYPQAVQCQEVEAGYGAAMGTGCEASHQSLVPCIAVSCVPKSLVLLAVLLLIPRAVG